MWETWVQFLGLEDSPGQGHGSLLQYSWASLITFKKKARYFLPPRWREITHIILEHLQEVFP